jgi:predicted HTH domain antitoxin
MTTVSVDLDNDVVALLRSQNQPVQQAVREMLVLELYRRGTISSGKGAQLLGMSRLQIIAHASHLGIAFFDMTEDEWAQERALSDTL